MWYFFRPHNWLWRDASTKAVQFPLDVQVISGWWQFSLLAHKRNISDFCPQRGMLNGFSKKNSLLMKTRGVELLVQSEAAIGAKIDTRGIAIECLSRDHWAEKKIWFRPRKVCDKCQLFPEWVVSPRRTRSDFPTSERSPEPYLYPQSRRSLLEKESFLSYLDDKNFFSPFNSVFMGWNNSLDLLFLSRMKEVTRVDGW